MYPILCFHHTLKLLKCYKACVIRVDEIELVLQILVILKVDRLNQYIENGDAQLRAMSEFA